MVFERAKNLECEVLNPDDWKTKLTREQVRDRLAEGHGFTLGLTFSEGPGWKDVDEHVSVCVTEIEHYEK